MAGAPYGIIDEGTDISLWTVGGAPLGATRRVTVVPTDGQTITIPDGCSIYKVKPSVALSALTIKMPATPVDGLTVQIIFTQLITTLAIVANTGQTLLVSPVSTGANTFISYHWASDDLSWYLVG